MKYSVSIKEMPLDLSDRRIYGKAFMPENKSGALKAVILSHGYNSSHEDLTDLAQALAEKGIFAYCYDFCGGSCRSKSSGSSEDMSVSSEILDLQAVIQYVMGLEHIDKENIYLYGESQGGFVSALTGDETIKGLYLLYPAFCIPDNWKEIGERGMPEKMDFMGMTLTRKYLDGVPQYDVFEHIGGYKGGVKIYHGDADTLVPIAYSEKAVRSFPHAKLTAFENEGHGFSHNARQKLIGMICSDFS